MLASKLRGASRPFVLDDVDLIMRLKVPQANSPGFTQNDDYWPGYGSSLIWRIDGPRVAGPPGSNANTTGVGVQGIIGDASSFRGDINGSGTSPTSICFWARRDQTSLTNYQFTTGARSSDYGQFQVDGPFSNPGLGRDQLNINSGDGSGQTSSDRRSYQARWTGAGSAYTGTSNWQHIAIVTNNPADEVPRQVYLNGIAADSIVPTSGSGSTRNWALNNSNANNLWMGGWLDLAASPETRMELCDFRAYDKVLSAAQVTEIYELRA